MDIKTVIVDASSLDLALGAMGMEEDDSLTTAVLISLFSDGQVNGERGWWGDSYPEQAGDAIAQSQIWLLDRAKRTPAVMQAAQNYANSALTWLVKDGVASSVTATASNPFPDVLALTIAIQRPQGPLTIKISNLWSPYV